MVLRATPHREIGQILAALASLAEPAPGGGGEAVRGWQIELLADSLERALETERDANEHENRPAVRGALGDLTLALCAHVAEIRALAEVADALPATEQDAIRGLAARARLAFSAAVRERRRMHLLRAMRSIPESGGLPIMTSAATNPFTVGPRRLVCSGADGEFRRVLTEQLRAQGFDACEAKDLPGLLDRVARTFLRGRWHDPLDVLVVDARREGLAALGTIEKVRAVDGALPAVVLVPEGTEVADEAARLGAAALVYAPHTVAAIATAIREILR